MPNRSLTRVISSFAAASLPAAVALAVPASPAQSVVGGGPGTSTWFIDNNGGTSNGLPSGGTLSGGPGLTVVDANLGGQFDAYDNGLLLFVDNSVFAAPASIDLTTTADGTFYTAGPVAQSGLNVTLQYFFDADTATARTFATFVNPTAAAIGASATFVTNVGSDGGTQVIGSGNGDTTYTAADRYVITDDSTTGGDPTNTHVLFGPGSPSVTPSSAATTVFGAAGTEGVLASFALTVPAGATRHLMFFNELDPTDAAALAGVGVYGSTDAMAAAGLFAGLTAGQLANTVNYAVVPEPATLAVLAGASVLGVRRHRRAR